MLTFGGITVSLNSDDCLWHREDVASRLKAYSKGKAGTATHPGNGGSDDFDVICDLALGGIGD